MALLKQSTAYTREFLLIASSDHISALTGATATVNVSKAGGTFAAAGGTVTEIANGWYKIALTTTDTNTLGDLAYHITATSADPTDFADQVVAFDPGDSAALGLSRIDAAVTSRMATFTLPTNFSSLVIDASGRVDLSKWIGVAVNALISGRVDANAQVVGDKTGYALTVGEHTSVSADVWDAARSGHTTAGSFGQGVASVQGNVTGSVASVTAAVDILQTAADKVWSSTTRTLTALGASLVQEIWDRATSALTTVGSIGKLLVTDIDATISSRGTGTGTALTATQVENAVWDATASSHTTTGSTGSKLNSAASAGDPMNTAVPGAYAAGTAGYILGHLPDSVWDVAIASHTSAGSVGNKLNSLSGASGSGALSVTVTVQNDVSHPVSGARFWVTTDSAGANIVASGSTDSFGHVTVFLNAGTYYGWAQKDGESFTALPISMVVS